jgi:hypothetical protein
MSEIASGRPERLFEMADDLIARRQEIARAVWFGVLAAAALNFLAGILATLVWEKSGSTWLVWTLPSVTLLACVFFAVWSYAGRISEQFHFEILFPFRRMPQMEAAKGIFYKPLEEFEQRVREFFEKKSQETTTVANAWKELIETELKTIEVKQHPQLLPLLNFLIDLAEFFIFDTLVHFGENSLTPKARFIRLGWTRPNYDSVVLHQGKELVDMKSNLIFRHLPDRVPQSLRFLKGFTFHRQPMKDQTKKGAGYFEFISQYGSVRFTISPFPIMLPIDSRDRQLIARYCGAMQEDIVALKIPFKLTVDFRGLRIMRKKFADMFAPCIEDLVDAVNHKIDWQHCAQHDLERMVVELLGKEV